jgi:predicted O-methyltransferase YrrM
MENIADMLLKENPSFHTYWSGQRGNWHSNGKLLKRFESLASSSMRTLEIGAGYSTVIFLARGCRHTSVTLAGTEIEYIKEYCARKGILIDELKSLIGESTFILPTLEDKFDLTFIDGAHRFPYPIVDWFYCSQLLKTGGLMAVDDINLISCHILW